MMIPAAQRETGAHWCNVKGMSGTRGVKYVMMSRFCLVFDK